MAKYRKYMRPFHPIRFLNLLPLSHMFGQSMATFVPPMMAGTVVFSHGYSPTEILRQIKSRRVSVLVCVPKCCVLREHVQRSPITRGRYARANTGRGGGGRPQVTNSSAGNSGASSRRARSIELERSGGRVLGRAGMAYGNRGSSAEPSGRRRAAASGDRFTA